MIETEGKKILGSCIHLLYPNSCSKSGLCSFAEVRFTFDTIRFAGEPTVVFASSALGDDLGGLRSYRAEVGPDIWVSFELRLSRVAFIPGNKSETKQRQIYSANSLRFRLWRADCFFLRAHCHCKES